MNYKIQEGVLVFDEPYLDTTVNVIRFPSSESALVISRSEAKQGKTIKTFVEEQMDALKKNINDFTVTLHETISTPIYAEMIVIETHYTQGQARIYQRSYTGKYPNYFIVYTYSKNKPLTDLDRQKINTYINAIISY